MLLIETWLVGLCAVGGFANEDIGLDRRDLCLHQMSVLLTTKVTRVEDTKTSNFDEEHACTQDVACMIGSEAETTCDAYVLVEVDGFDLAPGSKHLVFVKEIVIVAGITDTNEIGHEETVDGLGGMGHVDFAVSISEVGLFHDVGESGGMVEMEMGDENGVDGRPVELVDKWQGGDTSEGRMDASIADDGLALVLEDAARATNFLACAEHLDSELVIGGSLQSSSTSRRLRNSARRHDIFACSVAAPRDG